MFIQFSTAGEDVGREIQGTIVVPQMNVSRMSLFLFDKCSITGTKNTIMVHRNERMPIMNRPQKDSSLLILAYTYWMGTRISFGQKISSCDRSTLALVEHYLCTDEKMGRQMAETDDMGAFKTEGAKHVLHSFFMCTNQHQAHCLLPGDQWPNCRMTVED